jgi:hypothetical protein
MFGRHGHWRQSQRAKRRDHAGEHDVSHNFVADDRNERDSRVSVSAQLRDEASFISLLESSRDESRHGLLVTLPLSPDQHVGGYRNHGDRSQ